MILKEGRNYSVQAQCGYSKMPEKFLGLPFSKIISGVLGKKRFVSLTFVRQSRMKELNRKYRRKNYSTDILSFDMGGENEILISINDARSKARQNGIKTEEYLPYLFIHGLIHLKGVGHGSKMNGQEKKFCRLFSIPYPFN